jgi:hypothetical protein
MNPHTYLRAYLAGIFLPTLVLPLLLAAFILLRLVLHVPVPIERALIFPMAMVPSIFGLWNMLYLASRQATGAPIGLHGAILPLLMMPVGATVARCLGVLTLGATGVTWFQSFQVPYLLIGAFLLAALAAYYLIWKYIVSFLNRMVGIA